MPFILYFVTSVTVELFIYDLGCHEIFQDYIPKYVMIIYYFNVNIYDYIYYRF